MKRRTWMFPAMLIAFLMSASVVLAQPAGAGGAFGGGGPGRAEPAVAAQTTLEKIQAQLAAGNEEWAVLLPRVQALLAAYNRVQSGRGGRGGSASSAVARALQDVRDTLDNPNATAQQVTQKLNVLRELRARARATFAAAQKSLQELLTVRQEATMVALGYLE